MTAQSANISIKVYPVPAATAFTVKMHPKRVILDLVIDPATYGKTFLVEEPDSPDLQEFHFRAVAPGEQFDKPAGWSYLGQIMIVVDPDDDRPLAETFYLYGERSGH
jgi:hypothetical protein